MSPPRSPFRTNAVVVAVIGLVVGLLVHFIVLSSPRYNWVNPLTVTVPVEPAAVMHDVMQCAIAGFMSLITLL
jgi:hypothetical protein